MVFISLFEVFFKIGLVSFGGGYAMIPLIESEIVKRGWLLPQEIDNLVAVSEVTPGSISINTATFVGYRVGGFFGGLVATLGLVFPSLLVVLFAAALLPRFGDSRSIQSAFVWVKPAVIGLIMVAGALVAKTCLIDDHALHPLHFTALLNYRGIAIFLATAYCVRKLKMPTLSLIGLSSLMGIVLFWRV
ncbi:MAG TPA: chromate transporter [Firmicutes bacterium]|nr:chromate transporter [Candidatus Fermentithermobacillaceae bacterium]